MRTIRGIDLDEAGRCYHYHSETDIVALKCQACQTFYACYQCHDSLCDHHFQPMNKNEKCLVQCGACRSLLDWSEYKSGHCPHCCHPFNPKCSLHDSIYFK
ncbi:CHY zinc finger protein [Streptococcus dentasini]